MEDGEEPIERDKVQWEDHHLDFLMDSMLEQARIPGMKANGGLKVSAMKEVEKQMIKKWGPEFTLEKIKNKLKRAKPNLSILNEISNTSGFKWDPEKKMVLVDDAVWVEYAKKYPDRKKYRSAKKWKYYEHAQEIWGKPAATGDYKSAMCDRPQLPTGIVIPDEVSQTCAPCNDMSKDKPSRSKPLSSTKNSKKRSREAMDTRFTDMLAIICEYVKNVSDALPYNLTRQASIVIREAWGRGDIDDHKCVKAIEFFTNTQNATAFLCIPPNLRLTWVERKLEEL